MAVAAASDAAFYTGADGRTKQAEVVIASPLPQPAAATALTASSGNQANATATATLTPGSGKTAYITGFQVTGTGATAAAVKTVTLTGVITGTMHYTYTFVAGATLQNQSLIVQFLYPIPASAADQAIAVSCPAGGTGATNNTVAAQGFYM